MVSYYVNGESTIEMELQTKFPVGISTLPEIVIL